jgi:hypothetical protein
VGCGITIDNAFPIRESIEKRFKNVSHTITGFRACLIQSFSRDDLHQCKYLPVVQWKEDQTEITATYKVESSTGPCGSLLILGLGATWQPDGRRYTKTSVEWRLANLEDIKEMLPLLQNMLGLLHGPKHVQHESHEGYTDQLYVSCLVSYLIVLKERNFALPLFQKFSSLLSPTVTLKK